MTADNLEVRFYVRYGEPEMRCILHCPMGRWHWPRDAAPTVHFKAEIPREHWDKSLDEVAAFFDHGIKPRIRITHG